MMNRMKTCTCYLLSNMTQYENIYNLDNEDFTMSYRLDIIVDQVVGCMATLYP